MIGAAPPAGRASSTDFDAYAEDYESALGQGLRYSGEGSAFFARTRVAWTTRRLAQLQCPLGTVLDFGSGTGSTVPHLLSWPGVRRVIATDSSEALLEGARRKHGSDRVEFVEPEKLPPAFADLTYCNGVFHHIAPSARPVALRQVRASLRAGGIFALWENNPWNPGTRLVMRRIPFDRDAVTISAPQARRMLSVAGFEVLETRYLFVFPHALRGLRPLERGLQRLPLGGQYVVLARRPGGSRQQS